MLIFITFFVLYFNIRQASGATCPGSTCPLYNLFNPFVANNGTYLSTSANAGTVNFCNGIASDSCCDATKIAAMKSAFDTFIASEVSGCKYFFNDTIGGIITSIGQLRDIFVQIQGNRSTYQSAIDSGQLPTNTSNMMRKLLEIIDRVSPKLGDIKTSLTNLFQNNIDLGVLMLKTYAGFVCGMCDPTCLGGSITNSSGNINIALSNDYKNTVTGLYQKFYTNAGNGIDKYITILADLYNLTQTFSDSDSTSGQFDLSKIKTCLPACSQNNQTGCDAVVQSFTYKIIDPYVNNGAYCEISMTMNGTCPATRRLLAVNGAITYTSSGSNPTSTGSNQGVNTSAVSAVNGNTQTQLTTQINFGASGSSGSFITTLRNFGYIWAFVILLFLLKK